MGLKATVTEAQSMEGIVRPLTASVGLRENHSRGLCKWSCYELVSQRFGL